MEVLGVMAGSGSSRSFMVRSLTAVVFSGMLGREASGEVPVGVFGATSGELSRESSGMRSAEPRKLPYCPTRLCSPKRNGDRSAFSAFCGFSLLSSSEAGTSTGGESANSVSVWRLCSGASAGW